jgi:hypothetical protein
MTGSLRRWLLLLGVAGMAGTALELAMLHHWESATQLLAWVALLPLAVGAGLLCSSRPRSTVPARVLLTATMALALYGVFSHVQANEESGALDRRYERTWEAMSTTDRWWKAAIGEVGPAPTLAPALAAQSAVVLWLASCLPAGDRRRAPADGGARLRA